MQNYINKIFNFINPDENSALKKASTAWEKRLPTLWLLGKTGAGKSSLIKELTQSTTVEIGNGFSPCTQTAQNYDYPLEKPLLRFLDTRGLGEANYNPNEDIEMCQRGSHALIIMMKADETEQSDLVDAVKKIKKIDRIKHLLIVHTNILSLCKEDKEISVKLNQQKIEEAWGEKIVSIEVDFSSDISPTGIDKLKEECIKILPLLIEFIDDTEHSSNEEKNFNRLKKEIIWYAVSAGAIDAVPGIGLVTVPAIQGKMLHSLANQYGIDWNKESFTEFIGTLGIGFATKYSAQFLLREGVKFIPIYGQTVGAVSAVILSTASTYAIGRIGCKYLYHKSKGETVSEVEMKELYSKAFSQGKEVSRNETDKK